VTCYVLQRTSGENGEKVMVLVFCILASVFCVGHLLTRHKKEFESHVCWRVGRVLTFI
jgi:hypothetical protein